MKRVHLTTVAVEKQLILHFTVRVCTRTSARVALLIQHAPRRHIVICGLSGVTIFFDITS